MYKKTEYLEQEEHVNDHLFDSTHDILYFFRVKSKRFKIDKSFYKLEVKTMENSGFFLYIVNGW